MIGEIGEILQQGERKFLGTPKEVYCQILGVERMPNSPDEMPREVFLPPEILGDLEKMLLLFFLLIL